MKLNLAKCTFGISVGNFLRFMVTQRGIEVNLIQIKVFLETLVVDPQFFPSTLAFILGVSHAPNFFRMALPWKKLGEIGRAHV